MINVSKVVLINWMYFQKATFNLDGNAAIVGVNGTGKSTIIDAIQMANDNFNKELDKLYSL